MPYRAMWDLQRELFRERLSGHIPDVLLLLEHQPVVTLGKNAKQEHLLLSSASFAARGVDVVEVDRGGDVTYHGPGQLVGYWIFDLRDWRQDVHRYLREIEECLIETLAHYEIAAGRSPGATGVWVEPDGVRGRDVDPACAAKVAAIGLHLSHWVSTHGFALNLTTDISAFDWIVPCGLRGRAVTSMERLLTHAPSRREVELTLARVVEQRFERNAEWINPAELRNRLRLAPHAAEDDAQLNRWTQACPN